jgi:hypothetical protein
MAYIEQSDFPLEDLHRHIAQTRDRLRDMGVKVIDSQIVRTNNIDLHDYTFLSADTATSCCHITNYDVKWKIEMPHSVAQDLTTSMMVVKSQREAIDSLEHWNTSYSLELMTVKTKMKTIKTFLASDPNIAEAWNQLVVLAKLQGVELDLGPDC